MQLFLSPLFEDGVLKPETAPHRIKPVPPPQWELADHACRFCFGRMLQRRVNRKVMQVRCAECAKSAIGDPSGVCCCGADCGALGKALECFKNPNITADNPHEIMVRERLFDAQEQQQRVAAKPVHVNQY